MRYVLAAGYFFLLGYLAKKYDVRHKAGELVKVSVGELSRYAGECFADGVTDVVPEVLMRDLGSGT